MTPARPIQRYEKVVYCESPDEMVPTLQGEWVKYSDHLLDREALVRALERIASHLLVALTTVEPADPMFQLIVDAEGFARAAPRGGQ